MISSVDRTRRFARHIRRLARREGVDLIICTGPDSDYLRTMLALRDSRSAVVWAWPVDGPGSELRDAYILQYLAGAKKPALACMSDPGFSSGLPKEIVSLSERCRGLTLFCANFPSGNSGQGVRAYKTEDGWIYPVT